MFSIYFDERISVEDKRNIVKILLQKKINLKIKKFRKEKL